MTEQDLDERNVTTEQPPTTIQEQTATIMVKIQCCSCKSDWFIRDCAGITCAVLTHSLILYAEFVVVGVILLPDFTTSVWSYVHTIFFSAFALLAASSHLRAMTTNPGTIPLGNYNDANVKRLGLKAGDVVVRCTRCECIKTERAHHCSTCGRCVRKMDHHCPWINNCVGESNQKYFILFTAYIFTISAYAIALAIYYLVTCSEGDWDQCTVYSPLTTIVLIVCVIFEGLLFGIFTLIMFCTQVNSIVQDETGIEHLKNEKHRDRLGSSGGAWKDRLSETFGGRFGLVWFSPFASSLSTRKRQEYSYYDV